MNLVVISIIKLGCNHPANVAAYCSRLYDVPLLKKVLSFKIYKGLKLGSSNLYWLTIFLEYFFLNLLGRHRKKNRKLVTAS
jgi:hypothetical protein